MFLYHVWIGPRGRIASPFQPAGRPGHVSQAAARHRGGATHATQSRRRCQHRLRSGGSCRLCHVCHSCARCRGGQVCHNSRARSRDGMVDHTGVARLSQEGNGVDAPSQLCQEGFGPGRRTVAKRPSPAETALANVTEDCKGPCFNCKGAPLLLYILCVEFMPQL